MALLLSSAFLMFCAEVIVYGLDVKDFSSQRESPIQQSWNASKSILNTLPDVQNSNRQSFGQLMNCNLTREDIDEIVHALKSVGVQSLAYKRDQSTYNESTELATLCQKALSDIREHANKLADSLNVLKFSGHEISIEEYHDLEAAYKYSKMRLEMQIDTVKKIVQQTNQPHLKDLEVAMQMLNDHLMTAFKMQGNETTKSRSSIYDLLLSEISNNQFDSAIRHFKELNNDNYILMIVTEMYNIGNINKLFQFIKKMPSTHQYVIAYEKINYEMRRNNHIHSHQYIRLAYYVKQAMEKSFGYSHLVTQEISHLFPSFKKIQEYKNRFETLKASFTDGVKAIIWASKVCIRNVLSKHLFASYMKYDNDRRRIFWWQPGDQIYNGEWTMEPSSDGEFFDIKNVYYGEYLYAAFLVDPSARRHVFTWIPGGNVLNGRWEIEPNHNATYFYLKNIYYQEYLESDITGPDKDRRSVYTLNRGQTIDGQWQIVSC